MESGEDENGTRNNTQKTHLEKLATISENMRNLYHSICGFIESLGDDIVSKAESGYCQIGKRIYERYA